MSLKIGQGLLHGCERPDENMGGEGLGPGALRLGCCIIDFLLPPLCLLCGERIATAHSLCPACWRGLNFIEDPRCPAWGDPLEIGAAQGMLGARALVDPPPWQRLSAAVQFNDHSASLVHALKYRDRHEAAHLMARLMNRAGRSLLSGSGVLVPLPLHSFRLWRRRFNQAALLAMRLSRMSGLPYEPELLRRRRATKAQVGLGLKARQGNVRGAFEVPSERVPRVAGRRIVLVDDVVTTGESAKAACEALIKGGASSVDVLVFGLVLKPVSVPA